MRNLFRVTIWYKYNIVSKFSNSHLKFHQLLIRKRRSILSVAKTRDLPFHLLYMFSVKLSNLNLFYNKGLKDLSYDRGGGGSKCPPFFFFKSKRKSNRLCTVLKKKLSGMVVVKIGKYYGHFSRIIHRIYLSPEMREKWPYLQNYHSFFFQHSAKSYYFFYCF